MAWFDNLKTPKIKSVVVPNDRASRVPEGLWIKCPSCSEILQTRPLEENLKVCAHCQHHFRVNASTRIAQLFDEGSVQEWASDCKSEDPLGFEDVKAYRTRLQEVAAKMDAYDALRAGDAKMHGMPVVFGIFEFQFMGGSMGTVVGEKITRVLERAIQKRHPAILVTSSGGARMQEGIFSLLQMAKTSSLIERCRQERIPVLTLLTDPTTGGVAASFATLGDVIFAEPGALIGFAGPRVISQTIRQQLPKDAQRSEFLLRHGFLDRVIHRKDLKQECTRALWRLGKHTCRFPESIQF